MSDPSGHPFGILPPEAETAIGTALQRAVDERWAGRIWDRDASIWSTDPAVQEAIGQRLGWLDAPARFGELATELEAFASALTREGARDAVVLGMGGSSLAPLVITRTQPRGPEGIPVTVLDSTAPDAVRAVAAAAPPADTLYLVTSKSGTTVETTSFEAYFWHLEEELYGAFPSDRPGEHFAAITDPGASLEHFHHRDSLPHDLPQPVRRRRTLRRPHLRGPGPGRPPRRGRASPAALTAWRWPTHAASRARPTPAWRSGQPWGPSPGPGTTS